ncbi:hypothetical protein HOI18_02675 [Candidatus Uhrbacteria bacterium]|mgnify:CR=1 FL=1|jgi:hypothetical protein|nr:hypothetical protein [Candidatus Uhrbacteria bacterium]
MSLRNDIQKGITCDSVGKPDSLIGRTVCLSVHPGKMMLFPFLHWFNKRYKDRYKFARIIYSIDLVLIGIALTLGAAALFFTFYSPTSFEEQIYFDATVAPREVVSGAASTLIIRYTNGTEEELRNAHLSLTFPNHFLLQEATLAGNPVDTDEIALGNIPVGDSGSVRVRGVMFGDVGGEQTFTSDMRFVHGLESDSAGSKTDTYTFSPSSSTLVLKLTLPEQLVAFQPVSGTVSYKNTGEVDFPNVSIEPEWPEGFILKSTDSKYSNSTFSLPAINAGEEGAFTFEGFLGDVGEEVTFVFYPAFSFTEFTYKQETLTHTAPVVPPQIKTTQSITNSNATPGESMDITLTYKNDGDTEVSNVVIGVESPSPFVRESVYAEPIESLAPGESGEVSISLPLRSSISANETDTHNNLDVITKSVAIYTLGDGSGQRVTVTNNPHTTPLTSPIVLESFGRYTAASGDQLGRGPLPPRVGIETKYWMFWRMSGTTNDLESVHIEGELATGVRFTGRQTVSQNGGVEYNADTQSISWDSDLIESTLSPTSKIVAVAFELGITPTEDMVGSIPTLIDHIRFTAVDARTGEIITASGAQITTDLPSDSLASGKANVE